MDGDLYSMQPDRHELTRRERKLQRALGADGRERVYAALRERLLQEHKLAFAYVHGSFLTGRPFHDVDLAVCSRADKIFDLNDELGLEVSLERVLREAGYPLPVDVRLLNRAPLAFRYRVIREGFLLFCRDDTFRADFEARTFSLYFDFAPFQRAYLREVLSLGHGIR